MKKGKAPAFQFYVRDWLSDPDLQSCSASTRGIWINCLCFMWEAKDRGILSGNLEKLGRLLNATAAEFDLFIQEASVTKFADVTLCNNDVTLVNRRMAREQKTRDLTRLRVKRHRSNAAGNADVTPPSSSSSSSALHKNPSSTPSGGDVGAQSSGKQVDDDLGTDTPFDEPDPRSPPVTPIKLFPADSDEVRLSELLYSLILHNDPNARKPNIQSWAKYIDLIMRLDGRSAKQVEYVIRWCQADPFEQVNILSTKKLRERFTALVLKIKNNSKKISGNHQDAKRQREHDAVRRFLQED